MGGAASAQGGDGEASTPTDPHGDVLRALDAGDARAAVTLLLRAVGAELYTYVLSQCPGADDAREIFALAAEALWKGIPSFRRESSVKTWAYGVTRRVALHYLRDQRRRRTRFRLGDWSELVEQTEAKARTETLSFLRTERRSKLAALRASLSQEEQELLMLRIDRRMTWNDLALVLVEQHGKPTDPAELKRAAARLRQRFQALKTRLREAARRDGIGGGEAR